MQDPDALAQAIIVVVADLGVVAVLAFVVFFGARTVDGRCSGLMPVLPILNTICGLLMRS